jgi:hypothetical protein
VRLRARVGVALLSVSCALGGAASITAPAAHAQARSATSAEASVPNSDGWYYYGKYYSSTACHAAAREAILEGWEDAECLEEVDPDGTVAYWNLWVYQAP